MTSIGYIVKLLSRGEKIYSRFPEFQKPTWDTYTAQDLEILSDIITLATYTSRSLTDITPFSYMSLFRAYDVVLSTRKIDAKIDTVYYQFLLKLSLVPGNNWCEKFENSIKDLGLKSNIEQYNWIFNESNGSESDYTIESNVSFGSLDNNSIENTSNDINFKTNENELSITLIQDYNNVDRSVDSTTNVVSRSRVSNTIDYEKQSSIRRDFFNIKGNVKSENTIKGDYSILEKNALNNPISNFDNNYNIAFSIQDDVDYFESEEDYDPQEMERLKEKLRICFKEWSRFTIKIRAFRAKGIRQWKLAIDFHRKNLLKSYFHKLKNNYQSRLINKRLLDEKCKELMRKYLIKWYHRKQYEQAILIEQRNLLKRHFERWFGRIQHVDNQIQLAKRYKNQCCGRLLNKFFTKWLSKYKTKTENKKILIENFKFWRFKLIYNLLSGANQELLLTKYFNKWRENYYDKLDKLISSSQKCNYIEEGTEDTLVQRVFDKWRDRYNNNVSLAEMAEDDYNMKLIKSAFAHWKRVNKKRQRIIKEIDMQLKNRYFVEWYSRCLQRWKQKYRQRELAVEVLREWRSWTAKTRRKKNEQTNRGLVKSKQKSCNKNKD
ncbi:hypothetical protein GLOIN_2v1724568 [Rhizophagus clarus]|uniref:Sfi1 spindle body domain-containing protein n=1 Tax=Rhizophagus clarus TaxID=94130 RepID=A0A8H3L920_9GLOM|nr:hypothetical protein GLOIN_2v1724568 [Rhizophagus clarus]